MEITSLTKIISNTTNDNVVIVKIGDATSNNVVGLSVEAYACPDRDNLSDRQPLTANEVLSCFHDEVCEALNSDDTSENSTAVGVTEKTLTIAARIICEQMLVEGNAIESAVGLSYALDWVVE